MEDQSGQKETKRRRLNNTHRHPVLSPENFNKHKLTVRPRSRLSTAGTTTTTPGTSSLSPASSVGSSDDSTGTPNSSLSRTLAAAEALSAAVTPRLRPPPASSSRAPSTCQIVGIAPENVSPEVHANVVGYMSRIAAEITRRTRVTPLPSDPVQLQQFLSSVMTSLAAAATTAAATVN